jgi:hypothetical protein
MYECHCPYDGKMLAHIARPPLFNLRYVHLCPCGRRVEGMVHVEAVTKLIIGQAEWPCGRSIPHSGRIFEKPLF